MDRCASMTATFWQALSGESSRLDDVKVTSDGSLPSVFAVTDLASASIATAGLAISELKRSIGFKTREIRVDRRLSSMWFRSSIRPIDWQLPPLWDPIAGDYATRDGWIRLHTNAPHHRQAVERVLGLCQDRAAVQAVVSSWDGLALETAVVDNGGCAAQMRSVADWRAHEQGRAVASEPIVDMRFSPSGRRSGSSSSWSATEEQPLLGLRVLDLTRVLAGPTATRFLAGFGATVLRIDPAGWDEGAVIPDVTLGKRCARLNLNSQFGRERFEALLSEADVLVHGLRNGALDGLGYDQETRARIAPGLVDASLNAYGFSGPWAQRRGFDSLVQMSCGIASKGMSARAESKPVPLPVQALDYATGYLLAASVVRGLNERLNREVGVVARTSLARVAQFLIDHGTLSDDAILRPAPELVQETASDLSSAIELTSWGQAKRLRSPLEVDGRPMHWALAASELGSSEPTWHEQIAHS